MTVKNNLNDYEFTLYAYDVSDSGTIEEFKLTSLQDIASIYETIGDVIPLAGWNSPAMVKVSNSYGDWLHLGVQDAN